MLSPYFTDIYSVRRKVLTIGDYTLFHLLQCLLKGIICADMLSLNFQKIFLLVFYSVVCLCIGCSYNPITGQKELMLFPETDVSIPAEK